jgi:hypothetical protein
MRAPVPTFALLLVLSAPGAAAQSAADSAALRATALDYIDGWYTGDAERMERALHPHLAKRLTYNEAASGKSRLVEVSALELVQSTRAGYGKVPRPSGARTSAFSTSSRTRRS